MGRQAVAIIFDREQEAGGKKAGSKPDGATAGSAGEAVADGVFDEGLKDQSGDNGVLGMGSNVEDETETVSEADALDGEVVVEGGKFFAERDVEAIFCFDGVAEEVAQVFDHATGEAWLGIDLGGDGIQCVEEEVRVELVAEGVEGGLGGEAFEAFGAEFAQEEALVVTGGKDGGEDEPVDDPGPEEHGLEDGAEELRGSKARGRGPAEGDGKGGAKQEHDDAEEEAEGEMAEEAEADVGFRDGEAAIQAEQEQRDEPPCPPVGEAAPEVEPESGGLLEGGEGEEEGESGEAEECGGSLP